MKAKDTLCQPFTDNFGKQIASEVKSALLVQAEISFKASQEQTLRDVEVYILTHYDENLLTSSGWVTFLGHHK